MSRQHEEKSKASTQQSKATVFLDRQEPLPAKPEKIIIVQQLKAAVFVMCKDKRIELDDVVVIKSEFYADEINLVSGKGQGANGSKSYIIDETSNVISVQVIGKSADTFRSGTGFSKSNHNQNHGLLELVSKRIYNTTRDLWRIQGLACEDQRF